MDVEIHLLGLPRVVCDGSARRDVGCMAGAAPDSGGTSTWAPICSAFRSSWRSVGPDSRPGAILRRSSTSRSCVWPRESLRICGLATQSHSAAPVEGYGYVRSTRISPVSCNQAMAEDGGTLSSLTRTSSSSQPILSIVWHTSST